MKRITLLAVVGWVSVSTPAAAVPLQLAHQGRFLDAEQAPLEGEHDLHFGLYDAPTDGTLLWDETVTETFTGGFYSTVLGADDGNPLDDGIFATSPIYLELTVDGGDPLLPRQEINSVPFALRAGTSENLDGGYVDATEVSIDGDLVIDADGNWVGPTPAVGWTDLSGVPGGLLDGEDADVLGGMSCNDGFVAKYDVGSSLWACGADDVLDAAGVLAFVDEAVVNLGAGSSLAGSTLATLDDLAVDTLTGLSCADGGVAKYDDSSGLWGCDTDLVLDSPAVLGMVGGATIDLGLGSAVGGVEIATLDDLNWALLAGLPPDFADDIDNDLLAELGPLCADGDRAAWDVGLGDWACAPEEVGLDRLDTAGATSGQVLTFDGMDVGWANASVGDPCTLLVDDAAAGVAVVLCGAAEVPLRRWETFSAVAGGNSFTCGITATGTVRCWGAMFSGLGSVPAGAFTTVEGGSNHACAVDAGGLAVCWGENSVGQSSPPGGVFDEVCAGTAFSCGRRSTGTLECWGSNSYGKATPPSGSYAALTCSQDTACAIDSTGSIECWGSDANNVASPHSVGPAVDLDLGNSHGCAVTTSGAVQCWGYNGASQATPPGGSDFAQVAAGYEYTCGLRVDGSVECWGTGDYGKTAPPPATFSSIAAGDHHACGITVTGSRILCWGFNGSGQLQSP